MPRTARPVQYSVPSDHRSRRAAKLAARRTLVYVLDSCLRLLHPFMPYVTEEIWQRLPHEGPSLMVADWPQMGRTAAFESFKSVGLPSSAAPPQLGRVTEPIAQLRSAPAQPSALAAGCSPAPLLQ